MLVEVCANSLQSAINAEKAGAHRIELCTELGVGGITPSYGLMKAVVEKISIPVRVLIRPRSGDFTYTGDELCIMKKNIALCAELGFEGIVSGALKNDFSLDTDSTKQLIDASKGLRFTFHRAFDWVNDPMATMQILEKMGVDFILSSGQKKSAVEGAGLLFELKEKSTSGTIMPGGGIRPENAHIFREMDFQALHLSATTFHKTLKNKPVISMHSVSFLNDDQIAISNEALIKAIIDKVK